jgi:TP901 family phage tail tape measure protein
MAKGFSVFVNIGGKLDGSLAGAVSAAKRQVGGLTASLARVGAVVNAPFLAAQRHIDRTARALTKVQDRGRNLSLGVTAPAGLLAGNVLKDTLDFAKAGNMLEALGEATREQRAAFEQLSQDLARKYSAGGATGIMKTATELVKAGLSFEQARGSLEQVLATSVLSGDQTPDQVGAMLAKGLSQFQLPMRTFDESVTSATKLTDRLVYAAVKSTASLKDMGEMLKYVGGAASATGNDLDMVTAFGLAFAKNGTLGAEAGVALRSAIVRLVKMPKGGLAALERIGMNLGDYTGARKLTAGNIVSGLAASGIDASGITRQIDKILNGKLAKKPAALSAAITKAVQAHLGSSSVIDADTIAQNVQESITAAGAKVDLLKFFTDLKSKLDSGAATIGDVTSILEARHLSRYVPLLQSDLRAMVDQIARESGGYAQARYKIANQGLPAAVTELEGALGSLKKVIGGAVAGDLAKTFAAIADRLDAIGKASPMVLKLGTYFAAAAAAAGPLMWVLGAVGRVGLTAVRGVTMAFGALALGAGTALTGASAAFTAIGAGAVAALGRLRAFAAGFLVLSSVGGTRAVLAALGGSLLALGKSVLMFPVTAVRAIGAAMWTLVANPVGVVVTAAVVALAGLGAWVYNNWDGIKSFFSGFAEGFTNALGPSATASLQRVTDLFGTLYKWVSDLVGPISASNEQWKGWGATVGGVVADAISSVANGISKVVGLFTSAWEGAVKLKNAIMSLGGAAPAPVPAPSLPGRANGGPVTYARPYIVGERGPELFIPSATGRIETNGRLRQMVDAGTTATAESSSSPTGERGGIYITNHWAITGADDPQKVARFVESRFDALVRRMESEQRGLLSD